MRTLCLNLQSAIEPSVAEIFLAFSPQVHFRPPGFIFVDVTRLGPEHTSETILLKQAVELARKICSQATAAIADQPYSAQVLATYKPFEIASPGQDHDSLKSLSLHVVRDLEGLEPWVRPTQIDGLIQFFESIGFHEVQDLMNISLPSLRERWGAQGVQLWHRLKQKENQVVSCLKVRSPLNAYLYCEYSLNEVESLFQFMQFELQLLFLRCAGLGLFIEGLKVQLHCEYSQTSHALSVRPASPSRDFKLFCDLLKMQLGKLNLENPIKEIELELLSAPEKIEQLNFFEPRDLAQDRWQRLISFAQQVNLKIGFLQSLPSQLPEKSFELVSRWPKCYDPQDQIEHEGKAIQVKTSYAKTLSEAPRPSLLLSEPKKLDASMVERLQFLSELPIERIETPWWPESIPSERDYFWALSPKGQLLWIFKNRLSNPLQNDFYLQGYFD